MCTCTMDKICSQTYKEDNMMHNYIGKISIPLLEMVDDRITAMRFGNKSVELNAKGNSLWKNGIKFSHIGKKIENCTNR